MSDRNRPGFLTCVFALALACAGSAAADSMAAAGDEAPVFMLHSYNETVSAEVSGSTTPTLGNFIGVSPEKPRDAVLVAFLSGTGNTAADLEMLARLQRKYATWGLGLQVIAICVDTSEGEVQEALSAARSVNYPVLRDRFLVAADRYGVGRGDVPAAFLIVGERPNVALTPSEQAAIKDAYLSAAYHWTARIVDTWTGSLTGQEPGISLGIETVLQP